MSDAKKPGSQERLRMIGAVDYLTKYIQTYPSQIRYQNYRDETLINDLLYRLGVALGGEKYKFAAGFERFKDLLRIHLVKEQP